ncbi:MAG TPA: twin-arginine translocase TatA/TatE family subunit [Rhodothermales bacterium]
MGNIGGWEILLIFLVVLLVFGAKRIPEIARGLGKGIREFKDATANIKQELTVEDDTHRVGAPRQGTAMPRQDPYYYQQAAPPPPPQQQAPQQQAPQQQPPAPAQPSEQKTHTPE